MTIRILFTIFTIDLKRVVFIVHVVMLFRSFMKKKKHFISRQTFRKTRRFLNKTSESMSLLIF